VQTGHEEQDSKGEKTDALEDAEGARLQSLEELEIIGETEQANTTQKRKQI
jgi:hypothetical protein